MLSLSLTRPLVVLDLETTGVDVERDRIVSLAYGRVDESIAELRFNPGRPIPPEATAVHGITDADVADKPTFAQQAAVVFAALRGCDVAGFNLRSFDAPMLAAEFKRVGITWPENGTHLVDTFRIYNRKEPRTLGSAVRHYLGEEHSDAHNATADVVACQRVLIAQAKAYGATSLTELVALERDPSWLDQDGKIRWQGDVAVIGFGKWQGRPLSQVDPGYLRWMLDQNFPSDTRALIGAALNGIFPRRGS